MTAIGKRDGDQGAAGALTGVGLAVVLLVVAGSALLQTQGSTPKVLVAVWLWALPVIGIGAGAGWIVGRAVERPRPGPAGAQAPATVEADMPRSGEAKPVGEKQAPPAHEAADEQTPGLIDQPAVAGFGHGDRRES